MSRLFLDTGVAIAAGYARDQHHQQIADFWPTLLQSGIQLTTTSFVLDEIATYLNGKRQHAAAVALCELLLASPLVEVVHVDETLFGAGWQYFVRHHDKRYSLTERISFVVMEQRGLRQALTFDQHFMQAGFECLPAVAGDA
jgi:predicted nucleic acid-binding protein